MSKKRKRKQPADRPATRRYVQSMVRRLRAEMLKAQEAEVGAALNDHLDAHPDLARRPDGLTREGYPFTYTSGPDPEGTVARLKRWRVSG